MAFALRASSRRPGGLSLAIALSPLALAGCGDEQGSVPVSGSDAAPDGGCSPRSLSGWTPTWKPPRAPTLGACSDGQIERRFSACEDAVTSDAASCRAFERDPANAACQACLFSNESESSYGPVVLLRNKSWRTNTPGCIALVDGDVAAGGCAAKLQAVSACYDAACIDGCPSFSSFVQCRTLAIDTVCRPYYYDAVCEKRPLYAVCTDYATSREYFLAAAKFFCSTGLPLAHRPDFLPAERSPK